MPAGTEPRPPGDAEAHAVAPTEPRSTGEARDAPLGSDRASPSRDVRRTRALWLLRQGQGQRRGGPAARGHGDELVLAVGEAALEVELERVAPGGDEPGAVGLLRAEQERDPAPVRRIVGRPSAGLV